MMDGRHVLVVEDEHLLALDLARELEDAGAKVVGPVATIKDALGTIASTELDGAVVDVQLRDGWSFEVANALADRHVPFIFATGFIGQDMLPARHADLPFVEKPFKPGAILRALEGVMSSGLARG
jgi:DNA-binding NtrC family response regulator